MSNDELQRSVMEELSWDPKVDSDRIAVSAEEGVVTLRGTVGSLREKHEARMDTQRVHGVKHVNNKLNVQIMDDNVRANADLRGDILHALTLNTFVPATVDAHVDEGFVTLVGTANWQFQREEAQSVTANVPGVVSITNEVRLVAPGPSAHDVQHAIKRAMERNAKLDAESVSVESEDGTVTLRGTVSSWADHDEAVDAAWAAPGVTRVKDHILVAY
jgi:osmotically-inducible protein OsmY